MVTIDTILDIGTPSAFEGAAMELFAFQAENCPPYREYLGLIGVNPQNVDCVGKIPYLPIEIFKHRNVYCGSGEPQIVFTSSSTGGTKPSSHPVAEVEIYERTFSLCFEKFYGSPQGWSIFALLPNYLEREGSSLVYMVDRLIEQSGGKGGFYLGDYEKLMADMKADKGQKILLGVSYALWELAEKYPRKLENTVVMETGGMKGQRAELPKAEFHALLCRRFGVDKIHSEYGMAELTSQAYSAGDGIFHATPWIKITTRDLNDPFHTNPAGVSGGINIIDLANIFSCGFIQTQDVGVVQANGSFEIKGRADRSEIRGCNLMLESV